MSLLSRGALPGLRRGTAREGRPQSVFRKRQCVRARGTLGAGTGTHHTRGKHGGEVVHRRHSRCRDYGARGGLSVSFSTPLARCGRRESRRVPGVVPEGCCPGGAVASGRAVPWQRAPLSYAPPGAWTATSGCSGCVRALRVRRGELSLRLSPGATQPQPQPQPTGYTQPRAFSLNPGAVTA